MKYRLLIVDDTPSIHDDYKKILTPDKSSEEDLQKLDSKLFQNLVKEPLPNNYEIDSAYQGEEALKMVQKAMSENRPYAVAFVDVVMPPGWDGIETIKRIWEIDPFILVVICTAYATKSWHDMIQQLGVNDKFLILKKPFENIEIRQMANCLTQKWSLTQDAGSKYDRLHKEVIEEAQKLKKMLEKYP